MKKTLMLAAVACAALAIEAKDCKILVDQTAAPIVTTTKEFPGFGYVDDPRIGGEEVCLDYRHAGAWIFKSKKCDEATLKFLAKYDIRLLLVLEGSREEIAAKLKLIDEGGYQNAIAGFQLGDDVTGGGMGEAEKWRAAVAQIVKRFEGKKPIALPARTMEKMKGTKAVRDVAEYVPMASVIPDQLGRISHLVVDAKDKRNPYPSLQEMKKSFMKNKNFKNMKMWVIGPDRKPGVADDKINEFPSIAYKIHWLCAAYAAEGVDAVIFDQKAEPNDFGYTLRYLGLAFHDHPVVMMHGETKNEKEFKGFSTAPDLEQEIDDKAGFGEKDNMKIIPTPKAVSKFAKDEGGDVEYLVLANGGGTASRICMVMVNTSGEPAKVSVELKKNKSGNSTYRRMYFDKEKGKVVREAIGGYGQPGFPFPAKIAPDCVETVTFIVTGELYNKAGY